MADGTIIIDTKIDSTGAEKGLKNLNSKVSSGLTPIAGAIAKALGAAAITAGGAIIKIGSDFEEAMSKVKAISGATAEEMQALTEKAKEMGFKTKFSAKESAEAFYYMAQAGWKTQDMLDGIAGVMDLAAASGADLATTSDIVTDALTAFKMEASESARFADVLARTSADTNTDVLKMGETFKYVGSIAGAMGYSIEDVSVAIGLMARAGVKASQAGTSLRSIITRMVNPPEQAAAAMEALGLSMTDASGNMKPFREVMEQLRKSMQGLSKDQQVAYAGMLAGKPGMSGLLAIVNATDDEFKNLTESIDNCEGASYEMARTMQDNLKGALEQLGGALESIALEIYEKWQEPLKNMVQSTTNYLEELNTVFKEKGFSGLASKIGEGMEQAVITITAKMPEFVSKGVEIVNNIIAGIQKNLYIFTTNGVKIVTSLIQGFYSVLPNIRQLGISFVVQIGNGIATEMPTILQSMQNYFVSFGDIIINNLPNIVNMGMKLIEALNTGIQQNLPVMLSKSVEIINKLVEGFMQMIPLIVQTGVNLISQLAIGLAQALPSLIPAAVDCVVTLGNAIIENLPTILNAGMQVLDKLVEGIVNAIPKLIDAVPKLIESFVNTIMDNLPKILEKGVEITLKLVDGILTALPDLIAAIPKIISTIVNGIIDHLPQIIKVGMEIIGKLAIGLIKALPTLIMIIPDIGRAIIDTFMQIRWTDIGTNIIKGIWAGIKSLGSWLKQKVSGFANSIADGFKGALGIHSPSRVMRDMVGKYIPMGISVGIDKGMPQLEEDTISNIRGLYTKIQGVINRDSMGIGNRSTGGSYINNIINNSSPNINNLINNHIDIDGKEVARSIAPYQAEFDNYILGR